MGLGIREVCDTGNGLRTYISGQSNTTDFAGTADTGLPIGVQVQDISQLVVAQIVEYTGAGGLVFCDSGAFGAFLKGTSVDFIKVLDRYTLLAQETPRPGNLAVVAPDAIGDMTRTAELQIQYLSRVRFLAKTGVEMLVPFQQGWENKAYVAHFRMLELSIGAVTLAFACNAAAWSPRGVASLVAELRPARVHLLDVGTKNLDSYADAVLWNSPLTIISTDANRTRIFLGDGREITEGTRAGAKEIYQESAAEFDQCYDCTELDHDIHNSPAYFDVPEAKELARLFGVTKPKEIDRWGKCSQEEADKRFQAGHEDHGQEWTWGCKLGYLIAQVDPYGYQTQLLVHCQEGIGIKEMTATLAAKRRQKESRRKAITKSLAADGLRRQEAYRIRSSQMVLFQAA